MPSLEQRSEPASLGKARAFIRSLLGEWRIGRDVADDAELLVTELVTNAVIHARTDVRLNVTRGDRRLEFSMSDKSVRPVQMRVPSVEAATGRGIFFLDQLAADWDVDPTADGKTVRFSLWADDVSTVQI